MSTPKRNIRQVPARILERIRSFDQDDVVAACVKFLRPEDLPRYDHLGLRETPAGLEVPPQKAPPTNQGRYSNWNINGREWKRTDLPKIWKAFTMESPNFGDWSRGSHDVTHDREVYRVDFVPPLNLELAITLLDSKNGGYTVKFSIEQVLNRRTPDFEKGLLFNLNLLQENVGAADVFPSAATLAEYTKTVRVDWQILPPGTVDEVVEAMVKGRRSSVTPDQIAVMKDRIGVMATLKPEAYVTGSDEFLRYFGAKFGEDCVAFENIQYGNAIYVMYENWQELSKHSRLELLAGPRDAFDRIVHTSGWKGELKARIAAYREGEK